MDKAEFERLVIRAVEDLPEQFRELMENVDVVVEDDPTPDQISSSGINRRLETLLGLYEGIPQTQRSSSYGLVPPDKISIFQKSIEAKCRGDLEITREISRVVRHEIAHHFGISDDRLKELEGPD